MAVIQIPTALRSFTDRKSEITVEGSTVRAAINKLAARYPDIKQHRFPAQLRRGRRGSRAAFVHQRLRGRGEHQEAPRA